MPELPEVETLRRNLERTLVGRRFASVAITLPKLFVALPPRRLTRVVPPLSF